MRTGRSNVVATRNEGGLVLVSYPPDVQCVVYCGPCSANLWHDVEVARPEIVVVVVQDHLRHRWHADAGFGYPLKLQNTNHEFAACLLTAEPWGMCHNPAIRLCSLAHGKKLRIEGTSKEHRAYTELNRHLVSTTSAADSSGTCTIGRTDYQPYLVLAPNISRPGSTSIE